MNAAVITETRHFNPQIIRDHLSMLPDDFELVVFCSEANKRLFNEFDSEKYIVSINNLNDYNRLLTSTFFWDKLQQYERVLIFQTDSKILRKGIEAFYEYSFIGAPLYHIDFPCMNGGLSLRDPKAMLDVINRISWHIGLGHEDIFYCNALKNHPLHELPTKEIAQSFSVETIFNLGSFAIHAANKYLSSDQLTQILTQYG